MRHFPLVFALVLATAVPAAALTLDLPVRRSGQPFAGGAYYVPDEIEVQLTGEAARLLSRNGGPDRIESLSLPDVDALDGLLGEIWFEPLFPGETSPPPGSREPDLSVFYIAHLPPAARLEEALERFRGLRSVATAFPVPVLPVSDASSHAGPHRWSVLRTATSDSLWPQYWLYQAASRRDIHAPEAWTVTTGDTSIVVAVLDTGILPYHPDLGGRTAGLYGNLWTNWKEAAGTAGIDDDGNLKMDDIHGWDFVHLPPTVPPDPEDAYSPEEDGLNEDNDPNDYQGHGTRVAGLIGALTDNGIGLAGAAPGIRLMPLRVGWDDAGGGFVKQTFVARALGYAARTGVTVANCSFETVFSPGLEQAVTLAVMSGVTIVSASGNRDVEPSHHYLGDRDETIAVAASYESDVIVSQWVLGPFVDLVAPGVNMKSTAVYHGSPDSLGRRTPGYATNMQGTSYATPLVAAAAALVQSLQVKRGAKHLLTPQSVRFRITETADDISDVNSPSFAGLYGSGRLNMDRALRETSGSTATRGLAGSVGAAALIPSTGEAHVAYLADNQRLIQIEPVTQDTVMDLPTGIPVGSVAAAYLSPGVLSAVFYATSDAGVFGVGADGTALPGSWPQPALSPPIMTAPALGDLDGDGITEIVSAGNDGRLFAWNADGTSLTGFPINTGASPLHTAPALSDLDGNAGAEIIVAALDGSVHAYTSAAVELTGWPRSTGPSPRPPVVMRLGVDPTPAVVITAGNQLYAFSPAGAARSGFPAPLAGTVTQDLAVGDLDGNGYDDIVLVTPGALDVRDSAGVSLGALGWPRTLPGSIEGPPVLGELSTTSAGPEVLVMVSGSLRALERDGDLLATLPKPGGAGVFPSIGQADADAAAEIIAGCGADSLFYIYDAGPGSASVGPHPWPTPRGNYARTGSRLYAPSIGGLSGIPAQVTNLESTGSSETSVSLRWTASGDDGTSGRPHIYSVHASTAPMDGGNFASAPFKRTVLATVDGGGIETYVFTGLEGATTYYFALVAVDGANFSSPLSNVISAATTTAGPLTGRTGVTLVTAPQPAQGSASLYWLAAPGGSTARQTIRIYDLTGRLRREIEVGAGTTGVVTWDGRDDQGRFVPAGLYQARFESGSVHFDARIVLLR